MPAPCRKHLCLSGRAVGRGQLCGMPAATGRRWLLRAEGKQSPWRLGCAPGVMGQPWNIPGSEGGKPEASGSKSEGEGGSWRTQEETVVTAVGPSWAGRHCLPSGGGGSGVRTSGRFELRSNWQCLCDGRERGATFLDNRGSLPSPCCGLSTCHFVVQGADSKRAGSELGVRKTSSPSSSPRTFGPSV